MARRRNRRSSVAPPLALTEIQASHGGGDHGAFRLNFCGTLIDVTVTREAGAVRSWIRKVRRQHLDRNSSRRRRSVVGLALTNEIDDDAASTVHLCVNRSCLIVQLEQLLNAGRGVPGTLSRLFADNRILFVGISNGAHKTKLEKSGIQIANITDLKDLFAFPGIQNPSYKEVVEAAVIDDSYSPFDLDHSVTYSDWSKALLEENQISQAAADAFLRYKIGMKHAMRY